MADVVILGAGLTGLSAAFHLEQARFFDIKIFEQNEQAGGLLRSVEHAGFTFDYTGHLLHISDDYFRTFLHNIADLSQFECITRNAQIFSHDTYTPYPFQMHLHGLPPKVIIECISGYINRKTSIKKPKNFHDWVLKYFGRGIGNHFFFPYNSKILAYDIKKVLPSWTGRFVPQTSLDAILSGSLTPKKSEKIGYNSSFYYPKKGGIAYIIKQLAQHIKTPIKTGYKAVHIDAKNKIVHFENGHQEPYKQLISTAPLDELIKSTHMPSNIQTTDASSKLLCNSVINLNLGFTGNRLGNAHWIYLPEKKYPLYRIGFWHNICPASVPAGCSAVYGEASILKQTGKPNNVEKIIEQSRASLLHVLGEQSSNVIAEKTLILDRAYVIYDRWREKNLAPLLNVLQEQHILSIGRYGSWKYSSMQEAVLDGKQAALTVTNLLKHTMTMRPAVTAYDTSPQQPKEGPAQSTL